MNNYQSIKRKMKKTTLGTVIFHILNYGFFATFTLLCAYPFYYMIINTISRNDFSDKGLVNFIPKGIHVQNYIDAVKIDGLLRAAYISVARTVIGTICVVIVSAFLGFMFTQTKMWGRKVWYRFVVVTMYFNAGLIPMYIIIMNLKLTNNFWVYIIPAIVQPFNIILVKTFVESLPSSLQEAAEIDGASVLKIFRVIILPLTKPILATIAIFSAVGHWNSFQDSLLYITQKDLYSLQYRLYTYINQANSIAIQMKQNGVTDSAMINIATQQTPTSIRMTVSVLVVLPILFIYPLFQKHFVKGIMIGAVKG